MLQRAGARQREGLMQDIKPANVLLSEQGGRLLRLWRHPGGAAVTPHAVAGLSGNRPCTCRPNVAGQVPGRHSDMFSLAVVVYELLTGRNVMATPTAACRITHGRLRRPAAAQGCRASGRRAAARAEAQLDRKAVYHLGSLPVPCWPMQHAPATRPQDSETQRFALLRALLHFYDFPRRSAVGADAYGPVALGAKGR